MSNAFAAFRRRRLQAQAHSKPLDFGQAGVAGSINQAGRITALNRAHPTQGYISLSAADPFPEQQRYDAQAVRAYRHSLTQQAGYGLAFDVAITEREYFLVEDSLPEVTLHFADGSRASGITAVVGEGVALQRWVFHHLQRLPRWLGTLRLQRAAYTQLTEGGPLPMPANDTSLSVKEGVLHLHNAALVQDACVALSWPGIWRMQGSDVEFSFAEGEGGISETLLLEITIVFGDSPPPMESAKSLLQAHLESLSQAPIILPAKDEAMASILERGLRYARLCCVPISESATCIITDHQLLPLAWTRDAYYTLLPLLQHQQAIELARRHLNWLFVVAERPGGHWGRAYLTNGRVKDAAFQLDQQLYPLLELSAVVEESGDAALWDTFAPALQAVLNMLLEKRDPATGLFPTEETPADDPVPMPYHLSSHILFWYTLQRLAPYLRDERWVAIATALRQAIDQHFITSQGGQLLYAYLTDGAGQHRLYHDANDLPLALAPRWGFCPADDPVWRATMNFAFSPANEGGYYNSGAFAGLGSVHTPAPWPLGDAQELLYAQQTGDSARAQRIITKLGQVAQWDGALPEAYNAQTGAVVSRHWFAWANAAFWLCDWEA